MRHKSFKLLSFLLTLILGGMLGAGFSSAILAQEESRIITACVQNDGSMRIAGSSAECTRNETVLQWNTQGSAGQLRPVPQGSPLSFYVVQALGNGNLNPGENAMGTVNCNAGDMATGGGYALAAASPPAGELASMSSYPNPYFTGEHPTGWQVEMKNIGTSGNGFWVFAICADLTP